MLLYLHVGFSGGRKGGLVFPSLEDFPQFVVIHTVKGFILVNEAEVDVFLEFYCFLHDPIDVGNLISGSSAFSKYNLYIWKSSIHVLLKPCLKDFEHYFANMWNEHNCMVFWTFLDIAFLWDWNENWAFLRCIIDLVYYVNWLWENNLLVLGQTFLHDV